MSESLVISSKVKKHIKEKYGMRSSDDVLLVLTEIIIAAIEQGAAKATAEKRKTIKGPDVAPMDGLVAIAE